MYREQPSHTTGFEGLLWYPVVFTGSLQGRITSQGDPCSHYREWVCSEHILKTTSHFENDSTNNILMNLFWQKKKRSRKQTKLPRANSSEKRHADFRVCSRIRIWFVRQWRDSTLEQTKKEFAVSSPSLFFWWRRWEDHTPSRENLLQWHIKLNNDAINLLLG